MKGLIRQFYVFILILRMQIVWPYQSGRYPFSVHVSKHGAIRVRSRNIYITLSNINIIMLKRPWYCIWKCSRILTYGHMDFFYFLYQKNCVRWIKKATGESEYSIRVPVAHVLRLGVSVYRNKNKMYCFIFILAVWFVCIIITQRGFFEAKCT